MRAAIFAGTDQRSASCIKTVRTEKGVRFAAANSVAQMFEHKTFGKPLQIKLRSFAFLRRVMRHGGHEHAHRAAAGEFHGGVNGAGGIFRGKATGHFHRRSQMADEAERVERFRDLRGTDGRVAVILRGVAAISDERRNQAGEDGVHLALGQRIDMNPLHTMLPELRGPAQRSRASCLLF